MEERFAQREFEANANDRAQAYLRGRSMSGRIVYKETGVAYS